MSTNFFHDWTLTRIAFDWKASRVTIELEDTTLTHQNLIAEGASDLHIPKLCDWGPSISINEVSITKNHQSTGETLLIEMQTGDAIRVIAEKIILPPNSK